MFTPTSLLEMAAVRESTLKDPDIASEVRRKLRNEMEDALTCAVWMEKNGLKELEHVGPFGPDIPEGNVLWSVRIKAGAKIWSTNPKYSRAKGGKTAGRAYQVTATRMHRGYVHGGEVHQGVVVWAGEGSYWYETDLNNVVILEGP